MNEQLGKIPFVHMENGLDYVFKFAGKSHRVAQKYHYKQNYEDTLHYAKKHAMRVFYVHHLKRDRLEQIKVMSLHNGNGGRYSVSFMQENGRMLVCDFPANLIDGYTDDYTQAFDYGIYKMLKMLNVEGIVG